MNNIDFKILDFIDQFHTDFLDKIMPVITTIGDAGIIWIVIALICLVIKSKRKTGIMLLIGQLLGFITVNLFMKNFFERTRPCVINATHEMLIACPLDFSFPSGHTSAAFISAVIIYHANKKMGILIYILASLIAFSRLYLYVHFPSDVLGGLVVGLLIGNVVIFFDKFLTK